MKDPVFIGVTGTNGKTSVTSFVRQIANLLGFQAAAIGQRIEINDTVLSRNDIGTGSQALRKYISKIVDNGIQVVAVEVYSAALARNAHNGIMYDAGAFTNLTRDHLDVHGSFKAYKSAKFRFFKHIKSGGAMIIPHLPDNESIIQQAKQHPVKCISATIDNNIFPQSFMNLNLSTAAALAKNTFAKGRDLSNIMTNLQAPPGRLEEFCLNDRNIIVDFAHNPDGLKAVLNHYTDGHQKPNVILSSKGGWPKEKRQEMGQVSEKYAEKVYVCDDDPRQEDPALIRLQLTTATHFIDIASRKNAIKTAIHHMQPKQTLVVAGRGADRYWVGPFGRHIYSDIDFIKSLGAIRISHHQDNKMGFFS